MPHWLVTEFALTEIMARPLHIPNAEFPYHVGARACNREAYPLPLETVWEIMCEFLWLTHMRYNLQIQSVLLMPNHYHMLVRTPDANLSEGMNYFMSRFANELNLGTKRINQVHGTRYFRSLVTSSHYYMQVYKYVYRNPVKAGIVEKVEDYKYSTLQMFLGQQSINLPLTPDDTLMFNIELTLKWLNTAPKDQHWLEVKRALKHSEFRLPRDTRTKGISQLESELL